MEPEDRISPSSDLCCVLCMRADETDITGNLSSKQGTYAHQNCLLYASAIFCKNSPTFDDLFGFDVEDVKEECKRGRKLKCSKCGKRGATAGCEIKSCKRCYHYPCAVEAYAVPIENQNTGIITLYCEKHNPNTSIVERRHAKTFPSNPDNNSSEKSDPDNSHKGSESDSETPRRSLSWKRKYPEGSSDSDDTQVIIDPITAPVEAEFEDITPPPYLMTTIQYNDGSRDNKKTKEDVAFDPSVDDDEYKDMGSESPSLLLPEYRHENVPFKIIEASIESVAESSSGPWSPDAHSLDKPISAAEHPAAHHSDITKHTSLSGPPFPVSTPSEDTGESPIVNGHFCKEISVKIERCASRNIPPVQMTKELAECHVKHSQDLPIDLRAPGGSFMAQGQVNEPVNQVGISDSAAALFWRRCNDVGCTKDIFAGLTRQLTSLAERVKNEHATQQDYAVSLRILEASGTLPEIFKQMEQDLEDQEKQLQRKREALMDAKAVLGKNLHI